MNPSRRTFLRAAAVLAPAVILTPGLLMRIKPRVPSGMVLLNDRWYRVRLPVEGPLLVLDAFGNTWVTAEAEPRVSSHMEEARKTLMEQAGVSCANSRSWSVESWVRLSPPIADFKVGVG